MNPIESTTTEFVKAARPFIKWAGGKNQLLNQFAQHYPEGLQSGRLTRYIEPFLGGGAVFFDIAQKFQIDEAKLFDINPELILVYTVVKNDPLALIELLEEYRNDYESRSELDRKRLFYSVRDAYNAQLPEMNFVTYSDTWVVRAAYMIFLNKTCFNGLYRLNSKGSFNVPFGKYKRPAILDKGNILQVSRLLQTAQLFVGSFESCRIHVTDSSFVYFDPPYRPLTATANFTSYSKDKFSDQDQISLAEFFAELDKTSDAKLMLSNSDPRNSDPDDDFFDNLYSPFTIHKVFANRMINSDANGRGKISELLITNF